MLAVNVYIPAIAVVIDGLVGLCNEDVKALGPVQLHDVAPVAPPVNVNVLPAQIGLGLADAVTPVGTVFTVTAKVFALLAPQALSAVTDMFPEVEPKVTVIPVVPCPAVMVAPEGTVHV